MRPVAAAVAQIRGPLGYADRLCLFYKLIARQEFIMNDRTRRSQSKGCEQLPANEPHHFASARPLVDPRSGDSEDDASSTKKRKLTSLAGTMLAEISLTKFVMAWVLLIGLPGLSVGLTPLVASAWLAKVSNKAASLSGAGSLIVLLIAAATGVFGIRHLSRMVERSFWALHSLAVQPIYVLIREILGQLTEAEAGASEQRRTRRRAMTAAIAGIITCGLAVSVVVLVWPYTRWTATLADWGTPLQFITPASANAVAVVGTYLAAASLAWSISDATMDQPMQLVTFEDSNDGGRIFRVAHLSDVHVVGERYGFRIESGRAGPRGNERLDQLFNELHMIHASQPLDAILVTGDMTDAGRLSEWAEFLERLSAYPALAEKTLILPGNHDVNVVDRANPARFELPTDPGKQLRQMRTLSAMVSIQGQRVRVFDRKKGRIGPTLAEWVEPHRSLISGFSDSARRHNNRLADLWIECFPQVLLPPQQGGVGVVILNSNSVSNFSFTNALGLVPAGDVSALRTILSSFPNSSWIVALHHHLIEYPMPVNALSERIGTALINGTWFVRQLKPFADRVLILHGHRHKDWIGRVGALKIISAPSPVMDAPDVGSTHFHIHSIATHPTGTLRLLRPQQITIAGRATDL
jgi:Calcineurin-like phosphoesterase